MSWTPEQKRARAARAAANRAATGRDQSGSSPTGPEGREMVPLDLPTVREAEPMRQALKRLYGHPRWKIAKRSVIARDAGICAICKHAGDWGKMTADHEPPMAERENFNTFYDLDKLQAVHTYPHDCTQCSDAAGQPIYCNQIKHAASLKAAQRRIKELTGRDPAGPHIEPEPEGRDF